MRADTTSLLVLDKATYPVSGNGGAGTPPRFYAELFVSTVFEKTGFTKLAILNGS